MLSIFSCAHWPFVCLLWRNVCSSLLPSFWLGCLVFLILCCLYILEINLLSVKSFTNIFSHSIGCLFIFLIVSFAMQKLLSLVKFYLFIIILRFFLLLSHSFSFYGKFSSSLVLLFFFQIDDPSSLVSIRRDDCVSFVLRKRWPIFYFVQIFCLTSLKL